MGKVKKMPSLAFASLFKRNKGQNAVKEKRQRSHQINMLEGPLGKKILLFTLPLAGCSILQQLFNSTDVAVVGRFSSSQALAAVGSNGPLINMLVLLFTGLSVGANVLIARYIGQNDRKKSFGSCSHGNNTFTYMRISSSDTRSGYCNTAVKADEHTG